FRTHGSSAVSKSIAMTTLISIPREKNIDSRSGSTPETCSTYSTSSPHRRRTASRTSGSSQAAYDCSWPRRQLGFVRISSPYASPIASRAASPVFPSAAAWNASSVSWKHRSVAAMKSSFFVRNSLKRYGCEMPAARAISSVDADSPCSAKSSKAASSTCSLRSAAVLRLPAGDTEVSYHSLTTASSPCDGALASCRRRPRALHDRVVGEQGGGNERERRHLADACVGAAAVGDQHVRARAPGLALLRHRPAEAERVESRLVADPEQLLE